MSRVAVRRGSYECAGTKSGTNTTWARLDAVAGMAEAAAPERVAAGWPRR